MERRTSQPFILRRAAGKAGALVLGSLLWLGVGASHAAETTTYMLTDVQGTVIMTEDAHGVTTSQQDYRPYGKPNGSVGPDGPGYTGHVNDPGTGLVYMQQRYYDPEVGRFLSVDPVVPGPGNIFTLNRYGYVSNNPITKTDPDGRQEEDAAERVAETEATMRALRPNLGPNMVTQSPFEQAPGEADSEFQFRQQSEFERQCSTPEKVEADKKTPPNPYGRRGGPLHQAVINLRIKALRAVGYRLVGGGEEKPEETIRTPGGNKSSRSPDITMISPEGDVHRENVGRSKKSGEPIARERRALDDIEGATGKRPSYTPYDRP